MTEFTNVPKEVEEILGRTNPTTSRRSFLKTSGLFVVSLSTAAVSGSGGLGAVSSQAAPAQAAGPYPDPDFRQLDSWIVIHEERRTIPDQTLNLMLIMMGIMQKKWGEVLDSSMQRVQSSISARQKRKMEKKSLEILSRQRLSSN